MNASAARRCVATVVGREAPVSAHLSDRATIYPDGRMEGFIGGACSRDIVRAHALAAMERGAPLLVQIRPGAARLERSSDGSRVTVPMTCTSEGAIDVFLDPCLPARRFLIAGLTPVAQALAALASAAGFEVTRIVEPSEAGDVPEADRSRTVTLAQLADEIEAIPATERVRAALLVATHGHYDEDALEPCMSAGLGYVGLVASRKRAAALRALLARRGTAESALAELRSPAGLDLGARDPSGVAISILAELVAADATRANAPERVDPLPAAARAIDPVCGMEVETAGARHVLGRDGRAIFFCCAGCLESFAALPAERVPAH